MRITLFHRVFGVAVVLLHLTQNEVTFNYIEGTELGDYVLVSPKNALKLEFYFRDGNTTLTVNETDRFSVVIYIVPKDNSKVLIALYGSSVTPIHYSPFKQIVAYVSRDRIELKNLDETFNNFRVSVSLDLLKINPDGTGKSVAGIGESAYFLIPIKPKIQCNQLNHNFDGDTLVECDVTSHPAASIVPTFASPTITSYDLTIDKVSNNHSKEITHNTFIIKFSPNLSIVNSKMGITAILDSHYTGYPGEESVRHFDEPLTDHTSIRLKYNDLLKMECTKMFMLDNDFAFKCLATNMKNVDFSVDKLVAKTQPRTNIIKVGPWETEFHYRIRSDIEIVNKTVVVTVKPNEGGNSIKSIINFELPAKAPPFNVTFTLNGKESTFHRLKCADLVLPFTITCSAYSVTHDSYSYIGTPDGQIHEGGVLKLENLTGDKVFGGWSCHVENEYGTSTRVFMSLILEDLPCNANLLFEGNISYHTETRIHAIESHQNVKFHCQSLCCPSPVVYSLQKIGHSHQKEFSYKSDTGQFLFDVSNKLMSGVWRCSVFNILGKLHSEEVSFMVPAPTESKTKESTYRLYLTMIMVFVMVLTIILGFLIVYLCLKSLVLVDRSMKYTKLNINDL